MIADLTIIMVDSNPLAIYSTVLSKLAHLVRHDLECFLTCWFFHFANCNNNTKRFSVLFIARLGKKTIFTLWKINIDPENHMFLVETNLPSPIWQGRTVNLLEGNWVNPIYNWLWGWVIVLPQKLVTYNSAPTGHYANRSPAIDSRL